jgi:hypothetical protein
MEVPIQDTGDVRLRKRADELDDRYLWWRADWGNRIAEYIGRLAGEVRRLARRK